MKKLYISPELCMECNIADIITESPMTYSENGSGYEDTLSWALRP